MASREPFADIHCHLLPGLDDGAQTWDDALAMARMAADDGIVTVTATVHQLGSYPQNHGPAIRELARQFQERLDREGIGLEVLSGADVRIEPELIRKVHDGEVLTLADGGRYLLLELPHELYLPLDKLLAELDAAGLVGILSHPERNQGILGRREVLFGLVEAGCLLQVTAGSLTGGFGMPSQQLAEWIVAEGLAHFVATDAHGTHSRRPIMSLAYQRVCALAGEETARELCCRNPARVVENHAIARGRRNMPRPARRSWLGWRRAG